MKIKLKQPEPTLQESLRNLANLKRPELFIRSFRYINTMLVEAADRIDSLENTIGEMDDIIMRLERRLDEREQFREDFSKHD